MTWRRAALRAVPWAVAAIAVAASGLLPMCALSAFPIWILVGPAAVVAAGRWHRSGRVAGLVAAYLLTAAGVFAAAFVLSFQDKTFMSG